MKGSHGYDPKWRKKKTRKALPVSLHAIPASGASSREIPQTTPVQQQSTIFLNRDFFLVVPNRMTHERVCSVKVLYWLSCLPTIDSGTHSVPFQTIQNNLDLHVTLRMRLNIISDNILFPSHGSDFEHVH